MASARAKFLKNARTSQDDPDAWKKDIGEKEKLAEEQKEAKRLQAQKAEEHKTELERIAMEQARGHLLHADETPGPLGFAIRGLDDPLREWIPLRHLVPHEEWVPPRPVGSKLDGIWAGGVRPRRLVLCVGPPSAHASDWAAPDAFGGNGTEGSGNSFVNAANRHGDELCIVELPSKDVDGPAINDLADRLAKFAVACLNVQDRWVAVGVSVGAWVLASLVCSLGRLGPSGQKAVECCERLLVVGFPPPELGLDFVRPEGLEDMDWRLACSLSGPFSLVVPGNIIVYHFMGDKAVTRARAFAWFSLQPSLQDGSAKSAYPMYGLQGNHAVLRHPWHRTELFWALAAGMGRGLPPPGATECTTSEGLNLYCRQASQRLGHGPKPDGLFIDDDVVLAELDANPDLMAFPNFGGWLEHGLIYCQENFTAGNAACLNGLDIRMYMDKTSKTLDGEFVGCRCIFALRFGNSAGISVFPGLGAQVHGGAIQGAMDEITAQTPRIWIGPLMTTRKITHTIPRPVHLFHTYTVRTEIERVKNDGTTYVVKATMTDLLGEVVAISTAELVDLHSFEALKSSAA